MLMHECASKWIQEKVKIYIPGILNIFLLQELSSSVMGYHDSGQGK